MNWILPYYVDLYSHFLLKIFYNKSAVIAQLKEKLNFKQLGILQNYI